MTARQLLADLTKPGGALHYLTSQVSLEVSIDYTSSDARLSIFGDNSHADCVLNADEVRAIGEAFKRLADRM